MWLYIYIYILLLERGYRVKKWEWLCIFSVIEGLEVFCKGV